jgi:hypothetical protein
MKKRGLSLQPLNRKAAMQDARQEFIKRLLFRALKRIFKEISKKFGSYQMIFTFAAAKTKRVH